MYTHTCIHTSIHIHIYIYITYICICIYIERDTYIYIYIYTHVRIYIYIYIAGLCDVDIRKGCIGLATPADLRVTTVVLVICATSYLDVLI